MMRCLRYCANHRCTGGAGRDSSAHLELRALASARGHAGRSTHYDLPNVCAARSSRQVAFGLRAAASSSPLTAMSDAGLRLKRMRAPRGLGRQHSLYGKDARMRVALGVPQTRLTRRRTPAAKSRYGVAGRGP